MGLPLPKFVRGLASLQKQNKNKMNAKSYTLQISVEERQIDDVLLSLLHTILFHRTTGKFSYQKEGSYTIGTLGFVDTDCTTFDLTYVRCNSKTLDQSLKRQISQFREALRGNPAAKCGTVILEFYQKKKGRWPFGIELITWEIWNITLAISRTKGELERQRFREKVAETVSEKILEIAQAINRPDYIPKMPNQSELGNVFDTSYVNVQPYLFKIHCQMSNEVTTSVGTTMRKLIRDTFSY
jgi:autophagy-related protein 101